MPKSHFLRCEAKRTPQGLSKMLPRSHNVPAKVSPLRNPPTEAPSCAMARASTHRLSPESTEAYTTNEGSLGRHQLLNQAYPYQPHGCTVIPGLPLPEPVLRITSRYYPTNDTLLQVSVHSRTTQHPPARIPKSMLLKRLPFHDYRLFKFNH